MLRSTVILSRQIHGVSRFASTKLPRLSNRGMNEGAPSSGDSFLFQKESRVAKLNNISLKGQNSQQNTLEIPLDKIKQFIENIPHLEQDQRLYIERFFQNQHPPKNI